MANQREIDEAVLYVKEAMSLLHVIDDEYAIECLEQALEFLLGDGE